MPDAIYQRILEKNDELYDKFALYEDKDQPVTFAVPTKTVAGKIAHPKHAKKVVYCKKLLKSYGSKGDLYIVNKDGKYHTTLLVARPDDIRSVVRAGVFDPEELDSPIAKILACYGRYKREVVGQEVGLGLVSAVMKESIIDDVQEQVFALQDLYECINNYHDYLTPQANLQIVLKKIR